MLVGVRRVVAPAVLVLLPGGLAACGGDSGRQLLVRGDKIAAAIRELADRSAAAAAAAIEGGR